MTIKIDISVYGKIANFFLYVSGWFILEKKVIYYF